MARTPDEIKKGLECSFKSCWTALELGDPLGYPQAVISAYEAMGNALDLIQQLEAQNAQQARCIENMTDKLNAMNDEVAELQAERDAAVKDLSLYAMCAPCIHSADERNGKCPYKDDCLYGTEGHFEWRGVQKEG